MKHLVLAFVVLMFSPMKTSSAEPSLADLSKNPQWLKLLHYRGGSSLDDGSHFFLDPAGKKEPEKELSAFLTELESKGTKRTYGTLKQTAYCGFPARRKWLEKKLGREFPKEKCSDYEKYFLETEADAVSLVFSTAYPNNPASMFGHTFLKFSRKGKSELMDPAVSYAAMIGGDASIVFMIKGLFGGYPGAFSLNRYYDKINEYNHAESRDLWEYEIALKKDEVDFLRDHFWELANLSLFDYFFFDENCASLLLESIEVLRPDWRISKFWYYVIPSETTKKVAQQEGAVRSIQFRPSTRTRFLKAFSLFREAQKTDFFK